MRHPLGWYPVGVAGLLLLAATPAARLADDLRPLIARPTLHTCGLERFDPTPDDTGAAADDLPASATGMERPLQIQSEPRPHLPDTYTTQRFIISYTRDSDSPHAPPLEDVNRNKIPDYIERLGEYFERAWSVFTSDPPEGLGYAPPPLGRSGRYGILVYQLPLGYSGQTWTDSRSGRRATSHISINSWLSEPYVRGVAAHELFHAIQYGYNYQASFWWKEASAEWAAVQVFPEVDSYIIPYYDWFQVPGWSLDFADGWHEYGSSIWAQHLAHTRGPEVIREIWLNQRAENDALKATTTTLETRGITFPAQFHDFAAWNWFTGDRADGAHYAHGHLFPKHAPADQGAGVFVPFSGTVRRLATIYLPFIPPGGTAALARGLTIRLKNDNGIGAQLILEGKDKSRSVVPITVPRYHIPAYEGNIERAILVFSNADTGATRRYSGSISLGMVYRDQYGYVWDLQVNWAGAVQGTVDVGDVEPWTVTGQIKDGAFRWRATNPTAAPSVRWTTGFDVSGTLPGIQVAEEGVEPIRWTNDLGRTEVWAGTVLDGPIPARNRTDRRGPALR